MLPRLDLPVDAGESRDRVAAGPVERVGSGGDDRLDRKADPLWDCLSIYRCTTTTSMSAWSAMHLGTGHPRPGLVLAATRRGAQPAGDQRDGEGEAAGDREGAAKADVRGSEADHGRSDHAPGVADREDS